LNRTFKGAVHGKSPQSSRLAHDSSGYLRLARAVSSIFMKVLSFERYAGI